MNRTLNTETSLSFFTISFYTNDKNSFSHFVFIYVLFLT